MQKKTQKLKENDRSKIDLERHELLWDQVIFCGFCSFNVRDFIFTFGGWLCLISFDLSKDFYS